MFPPGLNMVQILRERTTVFTLVKKRFTSLLAHISPRSTLVDKFACPHEGPFVSHDIPICLFLLNNEGGNVHANK